MLKNFFSTIGDFCGFFTGEKNCLLLSLPFDTVLKFCSILKMLLTLFISCHLFKKHQSDRPIGKRQNTSHPAG